MKASDYLLLLIPGSLVLAYGVHAGPVWVFVSAILALVPLADWIRRGTEEISKSAGPAIGGLLNVTFGNVTELILAIFVLLAGQGEVVRAQITGSIIGNSLLGLGVAILVGTWGRERLTFKKARAGLLSSLLLLSVIALLVPALFNYTERGLFAQSNPGVPNERLSLSVSLVLLLVYVANLAYTLVSHRDVFAFDEDQGPAVWPVWKSLGILALGTALIALESELIAHALEPTAARLRLSPFFLGITVLAVIGNVAEYFSAAHFARQNRMGLALSITVGSTVQVALLLTPLLVFVSYALGHPMNLVFENGLELIAVAATAFIVNSIAQDGETTWFEGLLLVAVYLVLGLAFFFATPGPTQP